MVKLGAINSMMKSKLLDRIVGDMKKPHWKDVLYNNEASVQRFLDFSNYMTVVSSWYKLIIISQMVHVVVTEFFKLSLLKVIQYEYLEYIVLGNSFAYLAYLIR